MLLGRKIFLCLFLCHIVMSLLLHCFPALSKCPDYSVGLSVEINVNKSVLGWNQEGPLVGYLPLMLPPAVAFHLLIHGNPFSGNDTNAKTLARMLKACVALFKPKCRLGGWGTNKYVALFYRVGAFSLTLPPLKDGGGGSIQSVLKLHCSISAWDTLHCQWFDIFCNLYTCDLFRFMCRWPAETWVIWARVLSPLHGLLSSLYWSKRLNFIWREVFWQQLNKLANNLKSRVGKGEA